MGAITGSTVAAFGSNYVAGDVIVIQQGSNAGATVAIHTVDGSGVPLTYTLPQDGFASVPNVVRGCGYSVQNNVPTVNGASPGTGFRVNITAVGPGTDASHGRIASFGSVVGGSGYAVNDTGYFLQGANISGVYRVTFVFGGAVSFFNFEPGDGYSVGPITTVATGPQPGGGSGFTFDVTAIVPCTSGGGGGSGYQNHVFGG